MSNRLLVGIYHRTGPLQSYNHVPMPSDKTEVRTPGHLPAFFDDNLLGLLELHDQDDQVAILIAFFVELVLTVLCRKPLMRSANTWPTLGR